MQIGNPEVAEIMGQAGFDWVAVDLEHGSIDVSQLPNLFRSLELGGTLPLVRLSKPDCFDVRRSLDAGAGGVIIPMVENAELLQNIILHSKWPPVGVRGVGFCRGNLYGQHFEAYKNEAQNPLIIPMIETAKALNNIDEILSVEGIDAVFIGPYDLSASIGAVGNFESLLYNKSIKQILTKANKKQVAVGIHVVEASKSELKSRISEGYQFIAFSLDTVLLRTSLHGIADI